MVRAYENWKMEYDFLAKWKCVLIKWNPALWKVLVNPDPSNAEIFFNKAKLEKFCNNDCKKRNECVDLTKTEIANLIW